MNITLKHSLALVRVLLKVFIGLILMTAVAATVIVQISGDDTFHYKLDKDVVNDITTLNPVNVQREISPTSLNELVEVVKNTSGPISIGGGRYSQGGQIAYENSLHIDMRGFNRVLDFNKDARRITVEAGITWRDIQEYIDPHDLSVRIMQTYANFTVGGSLSVNVHGRYIGEGPLVQSVEQIRVLLADGSLIKASPEVNSKLFYGVIGGYGGLGIIVEATLSLAENSKLERRVRKLAITEYAGYFRENIRNNPDIIFHNTDIYPPDYKNALEVSWYKTTLPLTIEDRLIARDEKYRWGPLAVDIVADYNVGKWIRQHLIDPSYYAIDRVAWRNWEASYDVRELDADSRADETYVLREYFVPVERFDSFVPKMADIFHRHNVNIINVSIRHAHRDPGTLLAWARNEVFAFVVYYRQGTDRASMEKVRAWSADMIDAIVEEGGAYYLPYQVFETPEQFAAAYPRSPEYFALKKRVDPHYRFRNRLWRQHYPEEGITGAQQAMVKRYNRGEEQTFLTIPEWYLVFNPQEYADYLETGGNPSDFPFFSSINEYWSLYDRVKVVVEGRYPDNPDYLLMLRVIGISTTVEYMYKGLYENTVGRFTRWLTGGEDTPEDRLIAHAHRAYSNLIFDKAWYEFDFSGWVGKIWSEPRFFEENFIRKLERKLLFTLEFGFKTVYAKLIKLAAETAYEPSDGLVYLTADVPDAVAEHPPEGLDVLVRNGQTRLVAIPRWGGFTRLIPQLAKRGVQFRDISGNERIALSYVSSADDSAEIAQATTIFSSPFVSDKAKQRNYAFTRVDDLHRVLAELEKKRYRVEHIYDY